MKLSATQVLLASAELCLALPHLDSPRQRLLNGIDLPEKWLKNSNTKKADPYKPDYRDPYDGYVDSVGDDLDPLPWRNGAGASVLGPWNPERARQNPDLIRPPSTDRGGVSNMRWSFVDSHIRIEVSYEQRHDIVAPASQPTNRIHDS